MPLRLLVIFYSAFATFLVAQSLNHENAHDLIRLNQSSLNQSSLNQSSLNQSSPNDGNTGIFIFPEIFWEGNSTLHTTSEKTSIKLGASFQILGNTRVTLTVGNKSIRLWDSCPDTSFLPLPSTSTPPAITNIQSASCGTPCSGAGICNANTAECICPKEFSGEQCQSCAEGHFGPTCQPCPSNCTSCDQGITGSGLCLVPAVPTVTAAKGCKCSNGICGSNGKCTCLPGWGQSANGTACAQCEQGFFLTSGSCQICQLGCSNCEDNTGNCITCQSGFTQATDKTKCDALSTKTSKGKTCGNGSFGDSSSSLCSVCSKTCKTCNGPSSNNCIVCAGLQAMFNNSCVGTSADGICDNSGGMIADNDKNQCEGCGAVDANCVTCQIPNFNVASTINDAKCTGCLPGFLVSNGKCVKTCPSGTFSLGNTCTKCSSPCRSCVGAADHCLTCTTGHASSGKCVKSCPKNTINSNNTCVNCHPDCKTCKGTSFDQCLSCNTNLPVLKSGRCLATCIRNEYFNTTTSKCLNCDPSCLSCVGPGPSACLACQTTADLAMGGICPPGAS